MLSSDRLLVPQFCAAVSSVRRFKSFCMQALMWITRRDCEKRWRRRRRRWWWWWWLFVCLTLKNGKALRQETRTKSRHKTKAKKRNSIDALEAALCYYQISERKKCDELRYESSRKTQNRNRNRNNVRARRRACKGLPRRFPGPPFHPVLQGMCQRREPHFWPATCLSPATIGNRWMLNPMT